MRTTGVKQALGVVFLFFVSSCASFGASTIEKLDPLTSVTLTAVKTPMIFYRDNSGRAAYAKDFANLGPIQVNQSGRYRYFLWVGIWSTGQESADTRRRDNFEEPVLYIDGEPFQLVLAGWTPESIGASEGIYTKPVASAIDAYYEVTPDVIRLLVQASDVRLRTGGIDGVSFEPWNDQQAARDSLKDFLELIAY
ncbi:MAG: hypothetical protein OEW68_08315 [Gammaproteobacteria bacterium]|nr:hypothetical protein [Gammaproteobacteria bacterium]MDH5215418.1 hypothetical protein [Gammaproteobacteria bacterium]